MLCICAAELITIGIHSSYFLTIVAVATMILPAIIVPIICEIVFQIQHRQEKFCCSRRWIYFCGIFAGIVGGDNYVEQKTSSKALNKAIAAQKDIDYIALMVVAVLQFLPQSLVHLIEI